MMAEEDNPASNLSCASDTVSQSESPVQNDVSFYCRHFGSVLLADENTALLAGNCGTFREFCINNLILDVF